MNGVYIMHSSDQNNGANNIKQLLDEVEHDIVNYQNRGLCYQITQTRGFDNSRYHTKTEFNNCFIIHFKTIWHHFF